MIIFNNLRSTEGLVSGEPEALLDIIQLEKYEVFEPHCPPRKKQVGDTFFSMILWHIGIFIPPLKEKKHFTRNAKALFLKPIITILNLQLLLNLNLSKFIT